MPSTELRFPAGHPAFPGHFPGAPIVPGALLVAAAQAALEAQEQIVLTGLTEVRFMAPVEPDTVVVLDWDIGPQFIAFRMESAAGLIARGRFRYRSS